MEINSHGATAIILGSSCHPHALNLVQTWLISGFQVLFLSEDVGLLEQCDVCRLWPF